MPDLRAHFEARAAELADCSILSVDEQDGWVDLALTPHVDGAVSVTLVVDPAGVGEWIGFDDPADSGDDWKIDVGVLDHYIDAAVEGRVKAYRGPSRGVIEISTDDGPRRSYYNIGLAGLLPRPGWRRRATVIDYVPYRG